MLIFVFMLLVPTRSPQTPFAVTRNSRTIYCTWTPPPIDHQNGLIVDYRVNITEVITGQSFVRVSTTTSLEITSLHPDYDYQWVVTAVTTGAGPYTSVSTIKTPEDGEPTSSSIAICYQIFLVFIVYVLPSSTL